MHTLLRSAELCVYAVLICICGIIIVASLELPEGTFEPLGSGAVPAMIAGTIIVLCIIGLLRSIAAVVKPKSAAGGIGTGSAAGVISTPGLLAVFFAAVMLYSLNIQHEAIHFVPATFLFLFLTLIALNGLAKPTAIWAFCLATGISISFFLIFTKVFVVRLPGAF